MIKEWKIGERRFSTVHFLKLIQNLRDQFPYDPLTALVVETFANSLDAGATSIEINFENSNYKIVDNGRGMGEDEFVDYHNVASLTKKRGEGIGFAGVGAKIFLDRAEYIITETRSKNFYGATRWAFYGESLEWEPIQVRNAVPYPTGTYTEVKLKEIEDKQILTEQFVKDILQEHYNAILLGYYGAKKVTVNGRILEAWYPHPNVIEEKQDVTIRIGKHRIRGFLIKSKEDVPEKFQGPHIVVFGKTVMPCWFRQHSTCNERITGLIIADHLINVLTTSKSDFERTSMLWKYFHNRLGNFLARWLEEIGAKPKPTQPPADLSELSHKIEKTINELLKMPEFADLANKIFQNIMQRTIGTQSKDGKYRGIELEGGQIIKGTLGGLGEGKGIDTIGSEEGMGIVESEKGEKPLERIRRRVKGGIRVSYEDQPENLLEGWIDPGTQTITINRGHPSWKVADGLTIQARSEHVRVYHILRTVFTVLTEEAGVESPKEIMRNLFSRWYQSYIAE